MTLRITPLCWSLALCLLTPLGAEAHGMFGSAAPFWSGVLHIFVTPLALVGIAGLIAVTASVVEAAVLPAVGVATLSALLAATWSSPTFSKIALIGLCVIGVTAASGFKLTRWPALLIATIAGLSIGKIMQLDTRTWAPLIGVSVGVMVLCLWGLEGVFMLSARRWKAAVAIGCRVTGASVALIAFLLGFLEFEFEI